MQYFERELSKSLKKVNFIFLSNPISFNGQNYEKLNGPETSDQSLFRLQNKFRKNPLLVINYLPKFHEVISIILNILAVNSCKPIHDIINYSTFLIFLHLGSVEKKRKNYKNLNTSRMESAF